MQIWQKIYLFGTLVVAMAFVIVLAIFGNRHIQTNMDKEIHLRLFEFALDTLSQKPSKDNVHVRKWAVKVINEYAIVRMNSAAQKELVDNVSIIKGRHIDDAKRNP